MELEISYKIYLEADDISQSRIHSSIAFVKNRIQNCSSIYFKNASYDDESDLDAFSLRFYIENEIKEEKCSSPEDAESFVLDMAKLLDDLTAVHSYMDIEGSFSWKYKDEEKTYGFRSESGMDYCDFTDSACQQGSHD